VVNEDAISPAVLAAVDSSRNGIYRELADRTERKRKISEISDGIQMQRLLMTKGARKKLVQLDQFGAVDETKTVFKWRQERKK